VASDVRVVIEKFVAGRVDGYLTLQQVLLVGNEGVDPGIDDKGEIFRVVVSDEHKKFFFGFFGKLDQQFDDASRLEGGFDSGAQ
jgi:hypothetical protein